MKTALMCLFLCLLPWSVRAQDTQLVIGRSARLLTEIDLLRIDMARAQYAQTRVDTLVGARIYKPEPDSVCMFTIGRVKRMIDSARIHPEPWPDSELVAYVKHLVDSSLAQLGHWEMRVVPRASLPWDGPNWVIKDTSLMMDCIAWVWVKGSKK